MASARPQPVADDDSPIRRNIREHGGGSALCCPQAGWSRLIADGELGRLQALPALEKAVDAYANQAGSEQNPLHRIRFLARLHELLDIVHQRVEVAFESGQLR